MNSIKSGHDINPQLSDFMDLARWVSALLVVVTHVNNRMLIPLSQLKNPSLVEYAWGFASGFGHHAVVVFFTLSGFLVGGKVLRERRAFDVRNYVLGRVVRIYLVLIPVLMITATLDLIGSNLFPDTVYAGDLKQHLSWSALAGNLLNLQNMLAPTFGSNGPLGTLANEFWYYLTFPLLVAPFMPLSTTSRVALGVLGLTLLAGQTALMPEHGSGFVLWLTGAFAAVARPIFIIRPVVALGMFLVLLVGLRLGVRGHELTFWVQSLTDAIVAISLALILYTLRVRPWRWNLPSFNTVFADFSYSLYALHVPVIMLYCAVLTTATGFGWHDRAEMWWQGLCVLGAVLMALGAAYLLSLVTERHTATVRSIIRHRFVLKAA